MNDDKVKRYHYAYPEDKCPECGSDEYVAFKDYAALLCKHQTLAAERDRLRVEWQKIKERYDFIKAQNLDLLAIIEKEKQKK